MTKQGLELSLQSLNSKIFTPRFLRRVQIRVGAIFSYISFTWNQVFLLLQKNYKVDIPDIAK